jgi:hypothetical protein
MESLILFKARLLRRVRQGQPGGLDPPAVVDARDRRGLLFELRRGAQQLSNNTNTVFMSCL